MLEKFDDLRWVPVQPEFLEYPNAQILMIGEAQDRLGKAAGAEGRKQPHEQEPGEELEKFEHENEQRVEALQGSFSAIDLPFGLFIDMDLQGTRRSIATSDCMPKSTRRCRPPGTSRGEGELDSCHVLSIIQIEHRHSGMCKASAVSHARPVDLDPNTRRDRHHGVPICDSWSHHQLSPMSRTPRIGAQFRVCSIVFHG